MRVLVTRPREDGEIFAGMLSDIGIVPALEPLMVIDFDDDAEADLDGVQAILASSANGIRALARISADRELAVFAVGDATARAAFDAGYTKVESAAGDVDDLAKLVAEKLEPEGGPLFHAAASQSAGDLGGALDDAGFDIRRQVLYTAEVANTFGAGAIAGLKDGSITAVTFFSPRSADAFVALARKARIVRACRDITAYCLSAAVADQARALAWKDIKTAARPDQDAMIDLLAGDMEVVEIALAGEEPQPSVSGGDDGDAPVRSAIPDSTPAALPNTPPPRSSPRAGGGFFRLAVTVVVAALIAGAAAATLPLWSPTVVGLLPGLAPPPPEDARVEALVGRIAELERGQGARDISGDKVRRELAAERRRLSEQLARTMDRVGTLEDALGTVRKMVDAVSAASGTLEAEATMNKLSDRLVLLEQGSLEAGSQDRQLIETLVGKIDRLAARASPDAAREKNRDDRNVLLAVERLRTAARSAAPFAPELAALSQAVGDDPEFGRLLAPLTPLAELGVPPLSELRRSFQDLADKTMRPLVRPAGEGWVRRLWSSAISVVRIRKTSVDASDKSDAAAIARAEARLDAADIGAAVAELETLAAAARTAAEPWIETARHRVTVERTLARLQVQAVARLGRAVE